MKSGPNLLGTYSNKINSLNEKLIIAESPKEKNSLKNNKPNSAKYCQCNEIKKSVEKAKATQQNFLDAVKKIMKKVVRNNCRGHQITKQKHISPQKRQFTSAEKDNQYSNEYISFNSNPRIHN